jgi:2-polyprenyl-6-methoxyphenol hydroxylase-like FAD-dependent oxidoreductase
MNHADIAIAGAGVMGMTLAIAAARKGKKSVMLGQWPEKEKMGRMIALSYDSADFLSELGIFSRIQNTTPIRQVTVIDGRHRVSFHAHALQMPALGYTCAYRDIHAPCQSVTDTPILDHLPGNALASRHYLALLDTMTVTTRLLAITTPSAVDAKAYQPLRQSTIVTAFAEHEPLEEAFEIFSRKGPIAILPCTKGLFMVASL